METIDIVKRAYRKLKGHVYFDKTQSSLVDAIVQFDCEQLDESLEELAKMLDSDDQSKWDTFANVILEQINVLIYPKSLKRSSDNQLIFNTASDSAYIDKAQYFIDMPVMGHLIGVLWVLTVGQYLDDRSISEDPKMYLHSYGNRLRKVSKSEYKSVITRSPHLFESYFSQYQSWRDRALECAKKCLDNKKDVMIITLDFKSFFYSVDIDKESFIKIYSDAIVEGKQNTNLTLPFWTERVHQFVYNVFSEYSKKLGDINRTKELELQNRVFLPIGFLPSNIMSNWILTPFDNAINDKINPIYYGRYVDDIIIVDKIEKNSELYNIIQSFKNGNKNDVLEKISAHYFHLYPSVNLLSTEIASNLFIQQESNEIKSEDNTSTLVYSVNSKFLNCQNAKEDLRSKIQIQKNKYKMFYFHSGSTQALLDCFQTEIALNASSFRFLPDMDEIFEHSSFREIFKMNNSESLNKLHSVKGISIDKFGLSKFLGKYRKASNLISDAKVSDINQEILKIMDESALIENYNLWERLMEIMIVTRQLSQYKRLAFKIITAIGNCEIDEQLKADQEHRYALLKTFHAALCRTSALVWGGAIDHILNDICELANKKFGSLFKEDDIEKTRRYYCKSWMVNKYVLPLPICCIDDAVFTDKNDLYLCAFTDFFNNISFAHSRNQSGYIPFMISPQEISFALTCKKIYKGEKLLPVECQKEKIDQLYRVINYGIFDDSKILSKTLLKEIDSVSCPSKKIHAISVGTQHFKKIKVAIGNARLSESDFLSALSGNANRSFDRYQQLDKILKGALKEHADLLVLPENFLPFEWIPDIARICANNQIALVTGVEHIVSVSSSDCMRKVYNLTAIILPYKTDSYRYSHIIFHHKNHYSPEEKRLINGYHFIPFEGDGYSLCKWNDLWFSVYCCFEIASIEDRALFKNYLDLLVAVEWNKDTSYFSNIMESLSRDLHCYCVQVNSSDYGDSRVILPSKTEKRDLIKTKGGINYTVLTDEIDIDKLRSFQMKSYELQKDDNSFKTTPPDFNPSIPEKKQKRLLWAELKKSSKE